MARTLKTERDKLEADLIRIDRDLVAYRKNLADIKAYIDALTDDRLKIEARLCAIKKGKQ